jgi:DDE superfamily endonuclease/Transposase
LFTPYISLSAHMEVSKRTYSKRTTERVRIQIHTLRLAGYTIQRIADQLQLTQRIVQYTIHQPEKPAPRRGHLPRLSSERAQELITYVTSSEDARRDSYEVLAEAFNCGIKAIRNALRRHGYRRYVILLKPPLTERHKAIRLQWAYEHRNWTYEQWCLILWSDETWTDTTHHRKAWITRTKDELYHPDCVNPRTKSKSSWMFWGCFFGSTKGPGVFWEKSWGSINAERYIQHTLPHVYAMITANPGLRFMQDGASSHTAKKTTKALRQYEIISIQWPALSPDLNPIENLWNTMKDNLQREHGHVLKPTRDQLRAWIMEAWNSIRDDQLKALIESMPYRCQAVIDANGGHTRF